MIITIYKFICHILKNSKTFRVSGGELSPFPWPLGVPMLNESYYNFTNELYLEIKWYKVRNYRRVCLRNFVLANISMICEVDNDFSYVLIFECPLVL